MKRTFLYLLTVIFFIITGLSIPAQAYDIFQELNKVDNAAGKQYLHADEAFIVSIDNQADHSSVSIDIAPDYYLYRHLFLPPPVQGINQPRKSSYLKSA